MHEVSIAQAIAAAEPPKTQLKALPGYKVRVNGNPTMRGVGVCALVIKLVGESEGKTMLETEGVVAGLVAPETVRMMLHQLAAGAGPDFRPGLDLFIDDLIAAEEAANEPAPEPTDIELAHARMTEEAAPDLFDKDFPAILQAPAPTDGIETAEGSIGYQEHPANVPMDRPDTKE